MNRVEFLAELRAQLADFSEEAREDALKFYEEYLDEAGPENEAIVLAELGSPQKVARIIRANCDSGMPQAESPARSTFFGADWRAPRAPRWGAQTGAAQQPDAGAPNAQPSAQAPDDAAPNAQPGADAPASGADVPPSAHDAAQAGAANAYTAQSGPAYAPPRRPAYDYTPADGAAGRAGRDRTLWLILLIVTCPIWIGVFFGLLGGAFGLVGGLIGLWIGGFATMIAGFAAVGGGMGLLFSAPADGVLMIGVSLLCAACGALLVAVAQLAVTKLIPLAVRAVRWLWRRLFGNGGNTQ